MAIDTIESCEKYNFHPGYHTSNSTSSKGSNMTQCRLLKFNFTANGSVTSASTKISPRGNGMMSPYLGHDGLQLVSHLTEKNLYKQTEFVSSFPLAAKIYKANSDEFRLKKKNRTKKNKKSVLTLPNERSVLPQSCTASDMNDCEYFKREAEIENKAKKRLPKMKRASNRDKFEFYDRDAKYCSQVNIDLDCSSTDLIKNFKGDCRRKGNNSYNSKMGSNCDEMESHDVWAVLRNINKFQFNPSPPLSDDSIVLPPTKKKVFKKNKRKTASVIETCRTEQFYISSIDVQDKLANSNSYSSLDRITVVDNQQEFNEIFEEKLKEVRSPTAVKNKLEKCIKSKPKNKKGLPKDRVKPTNLPVSKLDEYCVKSKTEKGPWKPTKAEDNKDSLILGNLTGSRKSNDLIEFIIDDDCSKETSVVPATQLNSCTRPDSLDHKKVNQKFPKPVSPSLLEPKPIETSRIVLSKGQELTLSRRQLSPARKLRLVTTMPSGTPVPKLTHTDIRRRLANIKFPIVVLGRDQVSGNMEVLPYQYSQFDGLDERIWPFMLAWSNKRRDETNEIKSETKDHKYSPRKRSTLYDRSRRCEDPNNKKPTNYLSLNKQILKPKKTSIAADLNYCIPKKKEIKQLPASYESHEEQPIIKPKPPIRQFRDKILKLLYKKISSSSIVNENIGISEQTPVRVVKPTIEAKYRNAATNFNTGGEVVESYVRPIVDKDKPKIKPTPPSKVLIPTPPSKVLIPTPPSKVLMSTKPRFSKAKWTSAFIENVIRKLKTGAYYNNNDFNAEQQSDSKEISIQTTLPVNTPVFTDLTPKIIIQKKKDSLEVLPGFEDGLPELEIKSMTRNQIAVKHCVTNVVFQFDVCIPVEQDQSATTFKRSMTCIPITVTESKTKVFKCNTRIIHDILPAEICSILPKVMSRFTSPDDKLALPLLQEANMNSNLCTISELSGAENLEILKISLLPHIKMSQELISLSTGEFPKKSKQILAKSGLRRRENSFTKVNLQIVMKLLPSLLALDKQFYLVPRPEFLLSSKIGKVTPKVTPIPRIMITAPKSPDWCTDLVPYAPRTTNFTSPEQIFNKLCYFMQGGLSNSIIKFDFKHLPSFIRNTVTVDITLSNIQDIKNTVSINLINIEMDSIQDAFTNIFPVKGNRQGLDSSVKCIEYHKNVDISRSNKPARDSQSSVGLVKRKKKRYVRLYKKCKSTSHISAERCSTPINKINNLDDFFLAMGTGKLLSSAFEGYCGRKILASVIELKSWITDISPRQAMLVLLLNNKKDTPNLVRFRPVILQGIAVNRITRASEMDMEIEVIEREKFSVVPEHDGSRNMVNSVQDDNNLWEELCWIAKTTASDYQKPFNESSEQLLKDLLEKRKKLNPSYLRVMARYVGLGLLKPIKK